MLNRSKRIPYEECVDAIEQLKNKESIVIFTSQHEITIEFNDGNYYIADFHYTQQIISIAQENKAALMTHINKTFRLITEDRHTLDEKNNELTSSILVILYLEEITQLEPIAAIYALKAIFTRDLTITDQDLFAEQDILDNIKSIRQLLESSPSDQAIQCIHSHINNAIQKQKNKIPPNSNLNDGHKYQIKCLLESTFEDIAALDPQTALSALKAMTDELIQPSKKELFKAQKILGGIEEVRRILAHPCPQNKATNYPHFDYKPKNPNIIIYKNTHHGAAFERKGMLNLFSRIGEATYVTKQEVVEHIHTLINQQIQNHEAKLSVLLTLNDTQKNIIESRFRRALNKITHLSPSNASNALECITMTNKIFALNYIFLMRLKVSEEIMDIRRILNHDCPQNRTNSDLHYDVSKWQYIVVYKNTLDKPAFEEKGLLNLTIYNGNSTSVTKESVHEHLHLLIDEAIKQQSLRISAQSNCWATLFKPFTPNTSMLNALNKLKNTLTLDHLKQWTEIYHLAITDFTDYHVEALVYLIIDQNYHPANAVQKITQLSQDQLIALLNPNKRMEILSTIN